MAHESFWHGLGPASALLSPLFAGDERLVVDVGAGVGRLALALAELLPEASVLAVDREEAMVAHAAERFRAAGRHNARAVVGRAEALPLADGEADGVLMSVMLHDTAEPAQVVREARRVLRAGGRLALIEFRPGARTQGPPQELLFPPDDLVSLVREAGFEPEPTLDGPGPLYRITARALLA
jgi:ubiquinone/menaquinone biosynthesis C-methylase UbiE